MRTPAPCAFRNGDCPRLSHKRGLCDVHYTKARRDGVLDQYARTTQERTGTCVVADCSATPHGRGLCNTHHARLLRTGTLADPTPSLAKRCTVEGCERRKSSVRGWCSMHYRRWRNHGTTETLSVVPKILGPDSAGWVGESATYRTVHTRLTRQRGKAKEFPCVDCGGPALHWSYNGGSDREQISPEGSPYTTDLDCYSPRCNGCHKRLDAPPPTTCPQGHDMSGENVAARPGRHPGTFHRTCRTCEREKAAAFVKRRKSDPEWVERQRMLARERQRRRYWAQKGQSA